MSQKEDGKRAAVDSGRMGKRQEAVAEDNESVAMRARGRGDSSWAGKVRVQVQVPARVLVPMLFRQHHPLRHET